MRVLWIAPYPFENSSHSAPWVTELAKLISPHCKLTILTLSNGQLLEGIKTDTFSVEVLDTHTKKIDLITFNLLKIIKLKAWLRKNSHRFDLVHIHGTEHQYEYACFNGNLPFVTSVQGLLHKYWRVLPNSLLSQKYQWRLNALFELNGIKRTNQFICRTHWDKSAVLGANKNALIYLGWEAIRKEFFTNEPVNYAKNSNIFFIGGLNPIKGLRETLLALRQSSFKEKLLVAGGGNHEELNSIIRQTLKTIEDLPFSVTFLGKLNATQIVRHMQSSRFMIHPSYIDNSPNSICEAQVLGLPVIASNVGGVSSLIEQGRTGVLVPLNIDELSKTIDRVLKNDQLVKTISEVGKKMARDRHKPEAITKTYLNIYKSLIKQ
ncbi:MAG: glycosyltransferase [Cyclobacteriaceae bacterium]